MQGTNPAKAIGSVAAKVFLIFVSLVAFGMSSLGTYTLLQHVFPGDMMRTLSAWVMFDVQFVMWVLVFIWWCDNAVQHGIAAIALLGTLVAVFAVNLLSINLSGQDLVTVDRAAMGPWVIYSVAGALLWCIVWTLAHLIAHPAIASHISESFRTNALLALSQQKADAQLDASANEIAEQIAELRHSQALRTLADRSGVHSLRAGGLTVTSKKATSVLPASQPAPKPVHAASTNGHGTNGNSTNFTQP